MSLIKLPQLQNGTDLQEVVDEHKDHVAVLEAKAYTYMADKDGNEVLFDKDKYIAYDYNHMEIENSDTTTNPFYFKDKTSTSPYDYAATRIGIFSDEYNVVENGDTFTVGGKITNGKIINFVAPSDIGYKIVYGYMSDKDGNEVVFDSSKYTAYDANGKEIPSTDATTIPATFKDKTSSQKVASLVDIQNTPLYPFFSEYYDATKKRNDPSFTFEYSESKYDYATQKTETIIHKITKGYIYTVETANNQTIVKPYHDEKYVISDIYNDDSFKYGEYTINSLKSVATKYENSEQIHSKNVAGPENIVFGSSYEGVTGAKNLIAGQITYVKGNSNVALSKLPTMVHGSNNTILNSYRVSGNENIAIGANGVGGKNNIVIGGQSVGELDRNNCSEVIAIGSSSPISNSKNSILIGGRANGPTTDNISIGNDAWTEGSNIAIGSGAYSYNSNSAKKSYAIALGNNTYAYGGLPVYNDSRENVTGNGIAIGYFAMTSHYKYSSISIGDNAHSAPRSTSIGQWSSAHGENATAYGDKAAAYGENSVAIGTDAQAGGARSIVIGASKDVVGGENSISIGYNSSASKNSVAIGYLSSAKSETEENVISVGSSTPVNLDGTDTEASPLYRRIINVADAQNDHDAVTKAQMTTSISAATKYANVKKYNVQKFAISGTDAVTKFTITNKPENTTYTQLYDSEDGMVELEINHTIYHQDEDFTFDKDTGKIVWTATKENNGFDITTDLCNSVRVKYAYIYNA